MTPPVPTNLKQLSALLQQGEGSTLEFKRSTGELREGLQTICAFLNGSGGIILFGIRPDGQLEGQQVSDLTLRDVAQALDKFEPPINLPIERLPLDTGREILILRVEGASDSTPFTFEGRPFERVSSTTRKMSQEKYEKLLLKRGHAKRRWENMPAEGLTLKDLDQQEILRTRELAIQQNRIAPETSTDIGDILDRLGVRVGGVLTQAALVLYGKKFLSDCPQCHLKLGRFRGREITGTIVDNRQEHLHAFAMVREGMAFLERTLPLGARFPEGQIFREDRFPVPMNALREILLNAVMHRDYSYYGGHVAVVVFDDRIEVRSYGRLPAAVTLEQLSGPHLSELRNPLIAEAFHRTGAVEIWGRGTNRVIAECERHGVAPPTFEERQGFVIVTFRVPTSGGPDEGAEKTRGKTRGIAREKTREIILRNITANPRITTVELAQATGLSDKGVEWNIRKIKAAGLLRRVGPAKGGHWEVTRTMQEFPLKHDREKFETQEFIQHYQKLPHGRRLEVHDFREQKDCPDRILRDVEDGRLLGLELTSVYFDDKSVPQRHLRSTTRGAQDIPCCPEVMEKYMARLLEAVKTKAQKAQAYSWAGPLMLSIYVNEYESIFIRPSEWQEWVKVNKQFFDSIPIFSEIIFWPTGNDSAFSVRPEPKRQEK